MGLTPVWDLKGNIQSMETLGAQHDKGNGDDIQGGAGDDILNGGAGDDYIDAGSGDDKFLGVIMTL